MAMRYGQGSLLHTMREMYRGEIITLGNPRIRPWDVAILSDSYNDMVGPFEVEQVIHQFSHETGFITELKPSALVIANETSSWPIIEAMKIASLAMQDVDSKFYGVSPGLKFNASAWILGYGAGEDDGPLAKIKYPGPASEYREYLLGRAKEMQNFDPLFNSETGTSDLQAMRELSDQIQQFGREATLGLGTVFATSPDQGLLLGGALTLGGAALLGSSVMAGSGLSPSLTWLLGGPIFMLQCLRGDSIMVVPLMKAGNPIVSGINLTDPSAIWKNFKGSLGRWIDDTLDGTRDLTDLWRIYGENAWRRDNALDAALENQPLLDENDQLAAELTGELR